MCAYNYIPTSPQRSAWERNFIFLSIISHNILKKLQHPREEEFKCFSRYQQVLCQKGWKTAFSAKEQQCSTWLCALKGRKSLPNRFSLVNSYDFVIRENCTNCKPNMPNCDSSKLMPLITVSGETQWELEQQPYPWASQLWLAHCPQPPHQLSLLSIGFPSHWHCSPLRSQLWWRKSS